MLCLSQKNIPRHHPYSLGYTPCRELAGAASIEFPESRLILKNGIVVYGISIVFGGGSLPLSGYRATRRDVFAARYAATPSTGAAKAPTPPQAIR